MSEKLCDGKMAFNTKQEAEDTARVSLFKYGKDTKLQVYKCKDCGLWHLATKY